MRAGLLGVLAAGFGEPVEVLAEVTGLTAIPAGMNYVTIVTVNGGQAGFRGGAFGGGPSGNGGKGGNLSMAVNVPVLSHSGVHVSVGAGGGLVTGNGELGGATTARWDSSGGTAITLTLKHNGAAGALSGGGFDSGGGGGGRGGTETDAGEGGTSLPPGAPIPSGSDAAIFEGLAVRRGQGGSGGQYGSEFGGPGGTPGPGTDGWSGNAWGGGGGGGGGSQTSVVTNGGQGSPGGALLVFSELPLAYP